MPKAICWCVWEGGGWGWGWERGEHFDCVEECDGCSGSDIDAPELRQLWARVSDDDQGLKRISRIKNAWDIGYFVAHG